MNAISFSLYGDSPKYIEGVARNIKLAKKYYPDWMVNVYCDAQNFRRLPKTGDNVAIFWLAEDLCVDGLRVPPMFWRFLIADDLTVERFIVRDADSRIGPEEAAAVEEWIKDDTILHTCRAHPAHCRPINGGLWGAQWRRNNWDGPSMIKLIKDYFREKAPHYNGHDHDQHFLGTILWPMLKHTCTQHSSVCLEAYPGSKPFPMKWPWPRFMGEVWDIDKDGNESPRAGDWESVPK